MVPNRRSGSSIKSTGKKTVGVDSIYDGSLPSLRLNFISQISAALQGVSIVEIKKTSIEGDLLDPVTGSAHCALASYWSKKLGKCDFNAYQASRRGGVLNIHLDEQKQRVLLRGEAVKVMEGSILV
ncbi:hypothetical protein K1719_002967 [Acacia pycnantha]|nr:hypothetical protein K1719_002967 [Acacia pycnantha]